MRAGEEGRGHEPEWTIDAAVLEPDHALIVLRGRVGSAAVVNFRHRITGLLAPGVRYVGSSEFGVLVRP
jgi:hypothetical protein